MGLKYQDFESIEKSTLFRDNLSKYAAHMITGHPNLPILSIVSPAEYYLITRYSYEGKEVCEGHIYQAYQLPNGEKVIILEDGFTQHISGVSMAWHDSFFTIEKVKYFANFYNSTSKEVINPGGNHYYQVNSYIIYTYTSEERDSLVWYDYDVYSNDDGINIRFENNTSHLQAPWCGHSIIPKTCGYHWNPILKQFQKNAAEERNPNTCSATNEIEKSTPYSDNLKKYEAALVVSGRAEEPAYSDKQFIYDGPHYMKYKFILKPVYPAVYYLIVRCDRNDTRFHEGHIYKAYHTRDGEKAIILDDGSVATFPDDLWTKGWYNGESLIVEKVTYFANFFNTYFTSYYQVNGYLIRTPRYLGLVTDEHYTVWNEYTVALLNNDNVHIRFYGSTQDDTLSQCRDTVLAMPWRNGYYWSTVTNRFQKNTALDLHNLGEHLQKGLCAGLGITRDILNDSSTVSEELYEEFLNYVLNDFMLTNDMEENTMQPYTDKKLFLTMPAPRNSDEALEGALACLKCHDVMMDEKDRLEKAELAKHRKALNAFIDSIQNVYYRDPYTIVLWKNGEKTIVKRTDTDSKPYDPEFGLMACIAKYLMGNRPDYYDLFRKWLPEDAKPAPRPTKAELKAAANAEKEAQEAAKQAKMEELYAEWSKSNGTA